MNRWRVITASVRGFTHIRQDKPNQDAVGYWQSGIATPLILAVADGHGSDRSFRSEIGSQFAVAAALTTLRDFIERQESPYPLSGIKRLAEEKLPQRLVQLWQKYVRGHCENHPFSMAERELLGQRPETVAYGSTLLAVLVTEAFIIYWQLGDGDILSVQPSGEVERPLPTDERLLGNETTSLCLEQAWQEFRFRFQVIDEKMRPAFILLTTDGYANSFPNEQDFLQVASDFHQMLVVEQKITEVEQQLPQWLNEVSQQGSGDDISVGIICLNCD
jgi:serine/threonine protein phosphatase PrpC